MDKLATIAERLQDAMAKRGVSPSDLARACGVKPAAVWKWQKGGKMNADNSAAAARSLGVREEWLRTGRLPREDDEAAEEGQVEDVMAMLDNLHEPLSALVRAIEKLSKARTAHKKAGRRVS